MRGTNLGADNWYFTLPCLYVENTVSLSFLWRSQYMYGVDFVENALFNSSGDICWSPAFFASCDELSVNKGDSDGFFTRRLVSRSSDRSFNSTESSLNMVNCQLAWLGFLTLCVLILLTWHTGDLLQLRNGVYNIITTFLWLLYSSCSYIHSILGVTN